MFRAEACFLAGDACLREDAALADRLFADFTSPFRAVPFLRASMTTFTREAFALRAVLTRAARMIRAFWRDDALP